MTKIAQLTEQNNGWMEQNCSVKTLSVNAKDKRELFELKDNTEND